VLEPGWKTLELRQRESGRETDKVPLPRLSKGDPVLCDTTDIQQRTTKPPSHFTDATLLSAMTNIARFVTDTTLRKTLRETDGLGTEATRASIIEILFKRDYLYRDSRFIKATEKAKALIEALPEAIHQPDMTALWEATLESIRQGEADPRHFIDSLKEQISGFLRKAQERPLAPTQTEPGIHCPKCRAPMRQRNGKFGVFLACTRFPDCKGTRPIDDGAPTDGTNQKPVPCPHCYSPLGRRKSKKGWFWGCSNYPGCRQIVEDKNGQPAL
jgi:DNA topoisomerase-3